MKMKKKLGKFVDDEKCTLEIVSADNSLNYSNAHREANGSMRAISRENFRWEFVLCAEIKIEFAEKCDVHETHTAERDEDEKN